MNELPATGPLRGMKVVDCSVGWGEYVGRVLADLGANVLRIEPAGGHPARLRPPLCGQHEETHSLYWSTISLGTPSVTVDVTDGAGQDQVRELIATADVFIESWTPGTAEKHRLGFDDLATINPRLVYASVTSHGQRSARSSMPSSDLTLQAEIGLLVGDGDRPPIPIGYPQATFHAGIQTAADILAALYEVGTHGDGQYLDVSVLACMGPTLLAFIGYPALGLSDELGTASRRAWSREVEGVALPEFLRCADGDFFPVLRGAPRADGSTNSTLGKFIEWGSATGSIDSSVGAIDWSDWERKVARGELTPDQVRVAIDSAVAFIAGQSMVDVMTWASENGLPCAPILSLSGLTADPHLEAVGYWRTLDGHRHPGPFARMSRTPAGPWPTTHLAHEKVGLRDEGTNERPMQQSSGNARSIFKGLKVADFTWAGTGPRTSKYFADFGATVVHVESRTHLDTLRQAGAMKDGAPGINRSHFFSNMNTSKLGLSLNLAHPRGSVIARQLIDWADVVVESYSPGTMARRGLNYEVVSVDHDALIMVSTSLRGSGGPDATLRGYGTTGAALSGLHGVTGWPDRSPSGPGRAYTDSIAPGFAVAATIAALLYRRRTGVGQHVEISQIETATHFIEPLILDFTVNGVDHRGSGHASLDSGLHGVYRALGDERYVAVSTETNEQWKSLCDILDVSRRSWPPDDRDLSEIDGTLERWVSAKDAWGSSCALRGAGVAAEVVQWPADVLVDSELRAHEYFVELNHPEMGTSFHDGFATRFSRTPPRLRGSGPCMGADNRFVLHEILGYSLEDIDALESSGVLE